MNEEFVTRYYDGQNPIGRHVGIGSDPGTKTPIEIVRVMAFIVAPSSGGLGSAWRSERWPPTWRGA